MHYQNRYFKSADNIAKQYGSYFSHTKKVIGPKITKNQYCIFGKSVYNDKQSIIPDTAW